MKKFLALGALILSSNLFFAQQKVTEKDYVDFIPISPIQIQKKIRSANSQNAIVSKTVLEMSLDKKEVLNFVPNESMETTIQKFNEDGTVDYLYSGRSVKKGSYRLTVDYNKFTIKNINSIGGDCLSYAKVGVGLRIVANINTLQNKIDISSLVALGNAAKEGKISGTVGYEVIGIESKEITAILPINSEITSTVNQVFLQAISAIKGKIYDDKTRLYPQIIAVKNSGCETKEVLKNVISQYSSDNLEDNLNPKLYSLNNN